MENVDGEGCAPLMEAFIKRYATVCDSMHVCTCVCAHACACVHECVCGVIFIVWEFPLLCVSGGVTTVLHTVEAAKGANMGYFGEG